MHVNEATQTLLASLPEQPMVGISNVAQNMGELGKHYADAGYEHVIPFGFSYHSVTNTIHDQVTGQRALGMQYFKHPEVLEVAIGRFHQKFTDPLKQHIIGGEVKPHWNVLLNHELARGADRGVQAALGYIAHIGGGDLALTVYETEKSGQFSPQVMRDYVKHDYKKVDQSLAITANRLAPVLIEATDPQTRERMLRLAMGGIILGRKWARLDYHRLQRAKSEEKRQAIIHGAEQRTASFATFVLEASHTHQEIRGYLRGLQNHEEQLAAAA